MKKFLQIIGALFAVGILGVVAIVLLMPWMDRWGATQDEISGSFTGDELVPSPRITYTRAISINAKPKEIYPWIVQLGAEKGGMYSYSWFETNILQCELINADRIHEEWQNLRVGDPMKMCPGTFGPPPYEIAILKPNQAIVMGHKENGSWIEAWQFNLVPQNDGTTRLVIRSRSAAQGLLWDIIRPGEFIMMRGMMLGIKERAENLGDAGSITLEGVHLHIINTILNRSFPANCSGGSPACAQAKNGYVFLSITFEPQDLPDGNMLAYKNLPAVSVAMEGNTDVPKSLYKYENARHLLTLGFEVPETANAFTLKWADLPEIPLKIDEASLQNTVSLSEFGQTIFLAYDSALASRTETQTVPAVPFNDQTFYAGTHPTFVQISFPDFGSGQSYELPVLATENVAQVMVFQTADFHGFGDDGPQGFTQQLNALNNLLKTGAGPAHCTEMLSYEAALPFLPWINAKQVFCAQPQILEFANGRGVRYLSYYSQGLDPVVEQRVFYTFQGVTADGKFYVSALFPIQTGVFPTEPPACSKCSDPNYDFPAEWKDTLTKQLNQLNAQPQDQFTPSLQLLDELIQSIQIGQHG
jgi:hypothetical protein